MAPATTVYYVLLLLPGNICYKRVLSEIYTVLLLVTSIYRFNRGGTPDDLALC